MYIETDSDAGRLRGIIADYFNGVDRRAWPVSVAKSLGEVVQMPTVSSFPTKDIRTAIIIHLVTCGFNVQFDENDTKALRADDRAGTLRLVVSTAGSPGDQRLPQR